DHFAAGVLKAALGEPWSERMGEQVPAVGQQAVAVVEVLGNGVEIIASPVGSMNGVVALDETIVTRHPGAVDAGASHTLLLNVQRLGEGVAIGLQLVFAQTGVGERRQAEVTHEAPTARFERLQVGEHGSEDGAFPDDGPSGDSRCSTGGAGVDPLFQQLYVARI